MRLGQVRGKALALLGRWQDAAKDLGNAQVCAKEPYITHKRAVHESKRDLLTLLLRSESSRLRAYCCCMLTGEGV